MPRLRFVDGLVISEPLPHEVAQAGNRHAFPVALPEVACGGGSSIADGELAGVRESRDEQFGRMLEHTDGSTAAREWLASKTGRAALTYDSHVREGRIPKHR